MKGIASQALHAIVAGALKRLMRDVGGHGQLKPDCSADRR